MIGHPRTSTLFPNPTLSRSDRNNPATTRQEHLDTVPRFAGRALSSPIPIYQGAGRSRIDDVPKLLVNPDRKSTRLNSSHSQISYAVFCLKKKKQDSSS